MPTTPLIKSELKDIIIAEDGEVEAILTIKIRPINLLRLARKEGACVQGKQEAEVRGRRGYHSRSRRYTL